MYRPRRTRRAFRALDAATTYSEWHAAAVEVDTLLELDAWRDDDDSPLYDAAAIRRFLARLRALRQGQDVLGLAEALHTGLHRHLPDLSDGSLYDTAFAGTKRIVDDVLTEVEASIDWLAAVPLPPELDAERLHAFRMQRRAFGRSALLLSGGATLGFHHLGVCKALFEADALPTVLGGASMGAMIAAGLATRTDDELAEMFADPAAAIATEGLRLLPMREMLTQRAMLDPEAMLSVILNNCGDMTFAEAHARSGRIVNIAVSPTRRRQKPRVLCYLTASDVTIPSAALASSAVPGLFPPVQLQRRLRDGSVRPYVAEERWIDGSMGSDVPTQRVGRLHNVNHFIVSQTNPHVVPFVRHGTQSGVFGFTRRVLAGTVHRQGVQAVNVVRDVAGSTRVAPALDVAHAMWAQPYGGDITIVPPVHPKSYLRTVSNATEAELRRYVLDGERGTWPQLAQVRDAMRIARAIDRAVTVLKAKAA